MRSILKCFIMFVVSFLLCWGRGGDPVVAQELALGGIGPINHALAGAGVALPRDSAGAIQWNPATLSFLENDEVEIGLGRLNPPWYGDEYGSGAVVVAGAVLAWAYLASLNEEKVKTDDVWDWDHRRKRTGIDWYLVICIGHSDNHYTSPSSDESDNGTGPPLSITRVPTLSYKYTKPGGKWTFGLGISEYGARKVGMLPTDFGAGLCEYRFQGYEFIPSLSYREGEIFSFGFAPIFSVDETPNASLPVIVSSSSRYSGSQAQRGRAGFGMQFGVFFIPAERFRVGLSLRSPQLIEGFTYRWTDPETGEMGTRKLSFSQDSAFRIALGTAYTFKNERTSLALDFRYYDYSHASALYDIPASFDPEVRKLGIARGVYSLALGAEHRWKDFIAFRLGYQFNHAVTPNKALLYNTTLPIQSGHSIHYGVSFMFSERFDLSFSVSHGFAGGSETFDTADGPIRIKCNPNRSNFWVGCRFMF